MKYFYSFVSQISVVGDPVLNVNCLHVQSFDAELYRQLICYPQVQPQVICAVYECFDAGNFTVVWLQTFEAIYLYYIQTLENPGLIYYCQVLPTGCGNHLFACFVKC